MLPSWLHKTGRIVRGYWFLGGIALVLFLAHRVPQFGVLLDENHGVKISIVLFSLLSGLAVNTSTLTDDLSDWRAHLWIQAFTFIVTPVFVHISAFWIPEGPLKYGVYLVAVLPPTLSSCVAFTAAAGGNMPCALLNSVGGNVIGVFLSPLLLALMIGAGQAHPYASAGKTIADLCLLVLIPLMIGQLCRLKLPILYRGTARFQAYAGQICVLALMLCAFSKSMHRLLGQLGPMWQCFAYLLAVQILFIAAIRWIEKRKGHTPPQSAAAVFCSTQKTMALGLPLAYSFFAASESFESILGLVILPLVFYYLSQLVVGSLVIAYWARQAEKAAKV